MSISPINFPETPRPEEQAPEPTPPPPPRPPRRIPNFGHALIFVAFVALMLLVSEIVLILLHKQPATLHDGTITVTHPILQLCMMAGIYLIALLVAAVFFPLLWHRSFLDGLQWRWSTARNQANRLITLGFAVGVMMAVITAFISSPKNLPIDEFFLKTSTAWLITIFGTFVAPVFEEICFRGFLFPAFAIAYDWIALPRTPDARERWHATTTLTPASLIFSAVLTSLLFAMLHAQQDAHIWAALVGLFCVSLVLCWIRVRTQSVAASTMVHAAYNGFIFLVTIFATGGYRHLDRMMH